MVVEIQGIIKGVVDDLLRGQPTSRIAAKFHTTLGEVILQVCCRIRDLTGLQQVALSGGVFQNILLLTSVMTNLQANEFRSLHPQPGATERRRTLPGPGGCGQCTPGARQG